LVLARPVTIAADAAAAVIDVTRRSLRLEGCEVTAAARAAIEARGAAAVLIIRRR